MTHIKQQIKDKLLNKSGRLNSAVTRRQSFLSSQLHHDIVQATDWGYDMPMAQRVHAILNDILQWPTCQCGKRLTWIGYKNKPYATICGDKRCVSRLIASKPCTTSNGALYKTRYKQFMDRPIKRYNDEEIRQFIVSCQQSRFYFVDGGIIHNKDTTDMLRAIVDKHYTDWKDRTQIKWSQILYDVLHDIEQPPVCQNCNQPLTFKSRSDGYRTCNTKACHTITAKNTRIQSTLKKVAKQLSAHNIEVVSQGINAGPSQLKCDVCAYQFERWLKNGIWQTMVCPKCNNTLASSFQRDVTTFLDRIGISYQPNVPIAGNGRHVDIWIPDHNLAIECNGEFWHCDYHPRITRRYHNDKTNHLKSQGIDLIHMWRGEWVDQQEICMSMISNRLKLTPNRVYARKCQIINVGAKSRKRFFDHVHIQRDCPAQVSYGLQYNGNLVMAMSFGRRRITGNTSDQWEMLRMASAIDTVVLGGASRLFSHFIRMYAPDSVVSFCDRRWGSGAVYPTIGFTLDHISSPGYWYLINNRLAHRSGYMKHKLKTRLDNFDPTLTEKQNMANHGYYRVWDCGQYVYRYNRQMV